MKLFTAETGKFQMYIPLKWEYKNPSFYNEQKAPESFGECSKMIGAFQISCKPVNKHISKLIKKNNLKIQNSDSASLNFTERCTEKVGGKNYIWMAAVDDHFFLVTYIVDSKKSKTLKWQKELKSVRKALSSMKFIKPEYRDHVIAENRFSLFMAAMAATIDLSNKAIENGAFIEYVVLAANQIDALLRLSIILTNQLENKNKKIDISILFQSKSDRPLMEKNIYSKALKKEIIEKELFDKLNLLYNERNKVVHRYIITDIRTKDLFEIVLKYDELREKIGSIVSELEQKQFKLKTGIYGHKTNPNEKITGKELKKLQYQVKDKHGRIAWSRKNKIINSLKELFLSKLKVFK